MYREKLSHRVDLCRLVYTIIVLVVNVIWLHKVKLLILKRLHKSEQRKDIILEKLFFVQFRAFYIKEFTRQKKVTNKLFKTVRCIVIAKRGGGVRSAKWDSVSCVSMWWYMYIEGYFLFFEILRIRVLSMFRIACFCLLGVSHFLHYFTFSPHI